MSLSSPDVQGQIPLLRKRPQPSLSYEHPIEVYGDLTEEPDVVVPSAKLRRSSTLFCEGPYVGGGQLQNPDPNSDPVQPSENPDVGGSQQQNTDPVQPPAKPSSEPVCRTLKEKGIVDTCPPKLSKKEERDLKIASLLDAFKNHPAHIANRKRMEADRPILRKLCGPNLEYLPEAGNTVDPSKRKKMTFPDTPVWNTIASLRRKNQEYSKPVDKESWNKFVEDYKKSWLPCEVCLKTADHIGLDCPYLQYLPEGASVGPDVKIVCMGCTFKGEHDKTNCVKRAVRILD